MNNLPALAAIAVCTAYAQQPCENLTTLKLDRTTITSAAMVDAAPFKQIMVPAHCAVKGVAKPTSDSEINFELWMPPASAWNGKYMQRGNGGWAGFVPTQGLIAPLLRGYAASGTDDGHKASGAMPEAKWATGHPEKLIDFGYRALHQTAVQSKAIMRAFYGKELAQAYFFGCSDGGREALMEAQRYPEDFNGIIAGAPANSWTHHFAGFIWNELALKGRPETDLPASKMPAIQKAALAACDALDGVKDSLIEDPRKCHFDPSVLLCKGADNADCLTAPQIETLRKIYAGPKNPRTGEQIYPGYEPGTEADPTTWSPWILGGIQSAFGNSLFSGAVFENPNWDWHTMDFDRDLKFADEKVGPILNSNSPDLRTFRAHGGKLIQYHGWGDAAIAPRDSINYYEKVTAFLKQYPDPRSDTSKPVQDFYRLFMVPGMSHCGAGTGPNTFGNTDTVGPNDDAEHDIVLALDRWVTQGVAPDKIIGKGKNMTRPLCVYPKVAHYSGKGDPNDAANFSCVE